MGARCGCWDPTRPEEEPSPGPRTRRFLTAGRPWILPRRPLGGRSRRGQTGEILSSGQMFRSGLMLQRNRQDQVDGDVFSGGSRSCGRNISIVRRHHLVRHQSGHAASHLSALEIRFRSRFRSGSRNWRWPQQQEDKPAANSCGYPAGLHPFRVSGPAVSLAPATIWRGHLETPPPPPPHCRQHG